MPIYKQKGDPLECGNYRGITLLEHGMKILEKIIEGKLRKTVEIDAVLRLLGVFHDVLYGEVEIDPMQFGFMTGRGTIDTIFTFQQIQEKTSRKKSRIVHNFCCP